MWKQLVAFVTSILSADVFADGGPIDLDDAQKKKLDAASGKDGFGEKFMQDYNTREEATNANAVIDAFMAENGIDPAPPADGEEGAAPGATIPDPDNTLDARITALTGEFLKIKAENAELKGNIAKLEKLPEPDSPEAIVKASPKNAKMNHSKTHLFASGKSYDAYDKRPWNKAAYQASQGIEITAETNWTNTANIDQLNTDIQDYYRNNPMMIHNTLLDSLEMKKYVQLVSGISDEHTHTQIITGEITQSLKKEFLPKNKVKFIAEIGKVRDIQIDMLFKGYELKKLEKSFLKKFAQLGITDSNPHKERFVIYVVNDIMARARKEDKIVTGRGVYFSDPDRTTPASYTNNFDGFLKLIQKAKGVKYKPFPMGVPTALNMFDYVDEMCERLPYDFQQLPDLQYVMSTKDFRAYLKAREAVLGANTNFVGDIPTVERFPNIEIVPYDQMERESLHYITTKTNEYMLTDNPGEDGFIQFLKAGDNPRNMKVFGDYKLAAFIAVFGRNQYGLDVNDYENQLFFSNDVEILTESYIPVSANNATPSVGTHGSLIIGANNTEATDITNITDAPAGSKVYLRGNADANLSTVKNNANIILDNGDFVLSNGNILVLQATSNSKFVEVSRKVVGDTEEVETVLLAPDATTADATEGDNFITGTNTGATAITTIENAVTGAEYTITGGGGTPNATTIANGGNFLLTGDITLTDAVFLTVGFNGTKFFEIARG